MSYNEVDPGNDLFESLRTGGLIHECAENWSDRSKARLDQIGRGAVRPTETDVTRLMAGVDGEIERVLIEEFCAAGSLIYRPSFRLLSGVEFRRESTNCDPYRVIDLVVIDIAESRRPVLAIEVKFRAMVNGGFGYCTQAPGAYSNQIICYTHGCTNPRLDASVQFIWVGLALDRDGSPWGRKAIHDGDLPRLAEALTNQQSAQHLWHFIPWPVLWSAVASRLASHGEWRRDALLRGLGASV